MTTSGYGDDTVDTSTDTAAVEPAVDHDAMNASTETDAVNPTADLDAVDTSTDTDVDLTADPDTLEPSTELDADAWAFDLGDDPDGADGSGAVNPDDQIAAATRKELAGLARRAARRAGRRTARRMGVEVPARKRRTPLTVYAHIGTMKTGTSFLQQTMQRNSTTLAELGVFYPTSGVAMGRATRDVVEVGSTRRPPPGSWQRLADQLGNWPGRGAVVSSEFLSFATTEAAERVVDSLKPATVEVIVTARDLARLLPSAWQNKIKHGKSWPFPDYVKDVIAHREEPKGPARSFWHHHDLVEIASRWVSVVGPAHVTVVTLPPSGSPPDLLWKRFTAVLGLDPGGFDATQDQRSNLSIGYTEAELLRQVNRTLSTTIDREDYRQHVLAWFANVVLRPDAERAAALDKPVLAPDAYDWAIDESRRMVDALTRLGVKVSGDLEDLVPRPLSDSRRAAAAEAVAPIIQEPVVRAVTELLLRLVDSDPNKPGATGGQAPLVSTGIPPSRDDEPPDPDDEPD